MTSAAREAMVLPIAFLTVLLLGSVRVAETTVLAPPSVFAPIKVRLVTQREHKWVSDAKELKGDLTDERFHLTEQQ